MRRLPRPIHLIDERLKVQAERLHAARLRKDSRTAIKALERADELLDERLARVAFEKETR